MKVSFLLVIGTFFCFVGYTSAQIVGRGLEVDPYHYEIKRSGSFDNGTVACAHPLAAEVGVAVMKKGGNAFDAAIATQLALAVVYPGAGNIGGGGFMTARIASGNKAIMLDFREKAPSRAKRDMYLDKDGNPLLEKSQNGHLSVGVPGTVSGLFKTLPYAKLPFKDLIEPAIILAEKGFVLSEREAAGLNADRADFIKYNTVKHIAFVKDTGLWKAGDTLIQKDLAETLKRIQNEGLKGFYEGKTAKYIVEEMKRGRGIVTLDDLKNYEAKERIPLSFRYRGYDIISTPPPSSGGLILAQVLRMIEPFPVSDMGFHTALSIHLIAEAERRSFADRAKFMGDPDFWKVPDSALINTRYLMQRMSDFNPDSATPSKLIEAGNIPISEQTTHISIADKEGNMVAITTTLNNHFGSKTVAGQAGFILNDEMDDFSVKPGVPNMYGAVGGEANAIAPNKRMLSAMSPTLVMKDGHPFLVLGTPGGTTIPTSVIQSIVNIVDYNMDIENAIAAPKFHHQWTPDILYMEKGFGANAVDSLRKMGYDIKERGAIGRTEIVEFKKGKLLSASDPRGDDSVAGY
ncbi:MAG: gamma-glutamyltransferase [Pseudopedobacter saltans]|uniref:Glutathione hydrolase proenzyme n=1 Tax=Pseudopedobacter saltans TaxID=151895 RepID=A0A2W5F7Q2_9SPHI|nr:MAG: gamma-glutamyltransferase [Pseudopedobacter saltans]